MDKGYYQDFTSQKQSWQRVAIHNKNGQGLLQKLSLHMDKRIVGRNPQ